MVLDPQSFKFLRFDIFVDEDRLEILQEGFDDIKFVPLQATVVDVPGFIKFSGKPSYVRNQQTNSKRVITGYKLSDVIFNFILDELFVIRVGDSGNIPKGIVEPFKTIISKHNDKIMTINPLLDNVTKTIDDITYKLVFYKIDAEALDLTLPDSLQVLDYNTIGIEKYVRGVIITGNHIREVINIPSDYEFMPRGTYISACMYHSNGDSVKFVSRIQTHASDNIIEFKRKGVE